MRKAVSLCVFAGLLFSVEAHFAHMHSAYARDEPENQSKERHGTVEGQVVTKEGLPVADATVYAFKIGGSPLASTNIEGKFTLTNLSSGKHLIIAYKESDGFPNLVWSFYSEAYGNDGKVVVNVEENRIVRDAIIRVGPKAGRLFIGVIDAKTKHPITDASVTMNHKGKPKVLIETGATRQDGGFDLLIPPSTPINVVVKAPGYSTWRYVKGGSVDRDAIRLRPGASKAMTVELKQLG